MKNRMRVQRIKAKNWRNFKSLDVKIPNRLFIAGPNASGKSNFLDIFRFLRDVAKPNGGLKNAVEERGGLKSIRCLAARQDTDITIEITILDRTDVEEKKWEYLLSINSKGRDFKVVAEKVVCNGKVEVDRPNKEDKNDPEQLAQTHLEQLTANQKFRSLAAFFTSFSYLHLVPQLIRYAHVFSSNRIPDDPFGQSFLQMIKATQKRTRDARLKQINKMLQPVIPHFSDLEIVDDTQGFPHLQVKVDHWRYIANKQYEDQFSDGTLRLIGLFWMMLANDSLLLLEEPELSLHDAVVEQLPPLISKTIQYHTKNKKDTQLMMSTHSSTIFQDSGISSSEILIVSPGDEASEAHIAEEIDEVQQLLKAGVPPIDAIRPKTSPQKVEQLLLSFE